MRSIVAHEGDLRFLERAQNRRIVFGARFVSAIVITLLLFLKFLKLD